MLLTKCSILLFVWIAMLSSFARAQENIRFTQGDVNDSATLSLNVPLGSYKGRGIDLPVSLSYSSSVWSMEHLAKVHATGSIPQSITEVIYSKNSKAGWKSGLDLPIIEFPKFNDAYSYLGKESTIPDFNGCFGYRVARVFIHMPDGSTHELRKSDTPQILGYVETSGTFYAVDGSRMRYDGVDADTGTIYMPDGTRYILDAGDAQIIDRHGNTLNYEPSTRTWTDTLGRQIANPLPASPGVGTYEYTLPGLSGVNGGEINYTFKWEALADALTTSASPRYIASHYLPTPDGTPTNQGGSNYPTAQTAYGNLFHSETAWDVMTTDYSLVPTLVVGKGQSQGALFNPVVLTEITLPDGSKYQFSYNIYGEIDKVIYPTNAYEQYEFESPEVETQAPNWDERVATKEPYVQTERRLNSRAVSANGTGGDLVEWAYEFDYTTGMTAVIAPDATRTEVYKKVGSDYPAVKFGYTDTRTGMVLERKAFSSSGSILRRELSEHQQSTNSFNLTGQCGQTNFSTAVTAYRNPRVTKTVSLLFEGSGSALAQTSMFSYDTTYQYSTGVDQTRADAYHYAVISNTSPSDTAQAGTINQIATGSLAKYSETTFSSNSTYRSANILGLPTVVKVMDSAGNIVSQSEMSYDDGGFVPSGSTRGLPTTMKTWDSTKGAVTNPSAYLVTHATFDEWGNRTIATDAKGYATTTTYDSTHHAYPISVTSPVPDDSGTHGSNSAFTTSVSYDTLTGLVLSTTDINGQTTTMEYNDPLLRPTKVIAPNGHQTITEYGTGTTASTRFVKVRSQIDATNWKEAYSSYDGLGRNIKSQSVDTAGDVFVETEYDNMGRAKKATNPYRVNEAKLWTENTFDTAGRPWKITTPDNAVVETTYSLATSGNDIGTVVTVTDQALKQRRSVTNALGQLTRVDEPDANGNLGSTTAPTQPTNYFYNTLGKMVRVQQGVQNRYFMYDSLGRMLRVRQPEQEVNTALATTGNLDNNSWTAGFEYDNNGNVLTTTDPKGTTITSTYDALNRPLTRTYSDGTPAVTNYYDDSSVPFSKGKLTKVTSSISETTYTSFDVAGRLLSSTQRTPLDGETIANATPRTSSYQYNLSGTLTHQTYPSGRVVNHEYDASGDIARISGKPTSTATEQMYATGFSYFADGKIEKLKLGNGLWESAKLNTRLQATEIAMGHSVGDGSLMKLNYEYGELNTDGSVDTTKNAGNIAKQTVSFSGLVNPFVQTYKYDSLDRINEAVEKVNGAQTWKQTFGYDIYGNRNSFYQIVGSQELGINNLTLPTVDQNTNRFANGQGYGYDQNGNIINDSANGGRNFVFNGDNKQTEVRDAANNVVGRYYYDGNGKRVKKVTASEYTIFVYDGLGKLVAEYSTAAPPANPTINYTATDTLGSPRVLTDKFGQVVSRRDFMPFGEQLAPDSSYRTANLKYNSNDNIRQKFTGYQKDMETGLDFAEARYYNNQHGRFTAVDPLLASGKSANPQTFNRYVYAINNPVALIDPTGLQVAKPAKPQEQKPSQPVQKPPTSSEVQITGTRRDPGNEGYQLVVSGYTPIAINNGVVTDDDGNVVKDHGLKVTDKTNGFGIIVNYELSAGDFPSPDKSPATTFEEKITDSTLDGKPATPDEADVANKPVPGRVVDGKVVFQDWVGTKSESPSGPSQVSAGNQSITINTTIGGDKQSFPIRTNNIVINPKDKVKIKITDTTPKPDELDLQ